MRFFSIGLLLMLVVAGILVGTDAALRKSRSPIKVDGRSISKSEERAFYADVKALTQGIKPGDPASANLAFEPASEPGRRMKALFIESAKMEEDLTKAQEALFSDDVLVRIGTEKGREGLRKALTNARTVSKRYFARAGEIQDSFAALFDVAGTQEKIDTNKAESQEMANLQANLLNQFEKMVAFCSKHNASSTQDGPIFETQAQVDAYGVLVTTFDGILTKVSETEARILQRRGRDMARGLAAMEKGP